MTVDRLTTLTYEVTDRVARITFDRPAQGNATNDRSAPVLGDERDVLQTQRDNQRLQVVHVVPN